MKRRQPSTAPRHHGSNRLRIIGGRWRSRRLSFPSINGLRPTSDRIRETLFNWLGQDLPGSRCLDLFAGSGALGLEALSREAASVCFVELNKTAAEQLKANLQLLEVDTRAQLFQANGLSWLRHQAQRHGPFDLVFLDPPFQEQLLPSCIHTLQQAGLLADNAQIYLEAASDQPLPPLPPHWQLHRHKIAGQVQYGLIHCGPPGDAP